jgi:phospholipase C
LTRVVFIAAVLALALGALAGEHSQASTANRPSAVPQGIHKIKHVVVIMQENRSFDSYFGTFRGADGIPPGVCVPDPRGGCVRPYHDATDRNFGGPHALRNARRDIDNGAMDGFVRSAVGGMLGCEERNDPYCVLHGGGTDVMGYHDSREIPNYWAYARNFVLQDHMFEPSRSWSLPAHLFTVSEWSATCSVSELRASLPAAARAAPPQTQKGLPRRQPKSRDNRRAL